MSRNVLVWFRNDLRLHDHEPITKALSSYPQQAMFVYCLDPRHFGHTRLFGYPKTGPIRARFLFQALEDLRKRLRSLGNDLIILRGKPESAIPEFLQNFNADAIYYHEEATSEELSVETKLVANIKQLFPDLKVHSFWGSTLYHLDDLPFEIKHLPAVFTQFRVACEKQSKINPPFATPTYLPTLPAHIETGELPTLQEFQLNEMQADARSVLNFEGGESAGKNRLFDYFWNSDRLKIYKNTRNGLLGADYSSKFAPWLAIGCISPRWIAFEVARYERERVQNESTYWLVFELIWRDYFRFLALSTGNSLFHLQGPRHVNKRWRADEQQLNAWIEGRTGIPFVDANMRELLLTGFMSNRGRQNVASFLVKNLGIDWRAGAEWFESQLVDYDVCSNWGNWAYVAGVGNDPRQDRYFHVIKQARDYDPQAKYVKTWLPELESLSPELAHEPWAMDRTSQRNLDFGFQYGRDYPRPIIDLEASYHQLRSDQLKNPDDRSQPFHRGRSKRR